MLQDPYPPAGDGEYRGPASRAYLYYTSDHKHWVEPLAVKVRPAGPADPVARN